MEHPPTTDPEPDDSSPGLRSEIDSFIQDGAIYAQLRGELIAIETKEAALVYSRKSALIGVGAIICLFGYFIILAGFVGMIGQLLNPETTLSLRNWIGAAFGVGLLHLVVGFFLVLKGKKVGANHQPFQYTHSELQKDLAWMKSGKEKS